MNNNEPIARARTVIFNNEGPLNLDPVEKESLINSAEAIFNGNTSGYNIPPEAATPPSNKKICLAIIDRHNSIWLLDGAYVFARAPVDVVTFDRNCRTLWRQEPANAVRERHIRQFFIEDHTIALGQGKYIYCAANFFDGRYLLK